MTGYSKLTAGDVAKGVHETRQAIERAEEIIEKLSLAVASRPALWAAVSESTFKLRDHLLDNLNDLESAFAKALDELAAPIHDESTHD